MFDFGGGSVTNQPSKIKPPKSIRYGFSVAFLEALAHVFLHELALFRDLGLSGVAGEVLAPMLVGAHGGPVLDGVGVAEGINKVEPLGDANLICPVVVVNIVVFQGNETATAFPGIENDGMRPAGVFSGEVNAVVLAGGFFFIHAAAGLEEGEGGAAKLAVHIVLIMPA